MNRARTERRNMSDSSSDTTSPFKPDETILEQEVAQARHEISRPATGLFLSGLLAGFGVSVSLFLVAALLSMESPGVPRLAMEVVVAIAYATGFILVIMGHTDLFTEYTTMAILPVLVRQATVRQLVRLWALVFSANLIGAVAFSALAVTLGPRLGVADAGIFARLAHELVAHPWWVVLLSGSLTGWLMGFLSWLVSGARDTTSQTLFVGLITGSIGLLNLHHSVTGTAEVVAGVLTSPDLGLGSFGHFLLWTTLGNVVGGIGFAVLIRYSVVIGNTATARRGHQRESASGPRRRPREAR